MRTNLMAILILACFASGCASSAARGPGQSRDSGLNLDPNRSRSCYGGPVYVPC